MGWTFSEGQNFAERGWIIGSMSHTPVWVDAALASNHDFLMRLFFSHQPVDCRAAMQNRRSGETWDTYDNGDVTEAPGGGRADGVH